MSDPLLQQYEKNLLALAAACGKEQVVAEFWLPYKKIRHAIGTEKCLKAIEKILFTRRDRDSFPTPAELLEVALEDDQNSFSPEEISARIVAPLSRFGYIDPEGARKYIGPIGWEIVKLEGGWSSLCQRVQEKEIPFLQAQWRQLAEQKIQKDSMTTIKQIISGQKLLQ